MIFKIRYISPLLLANALLMSSVTCDEITITAATSSITAPFIVDPVTSMVGTNVREMRYCGETPSTVEYSLSPNRFGNNPDNKITTNDGTATMSFSVTQPGYHIIDVDVSTPSSASNSFFVKFDDGAWKSWGGVPVTGGVLKTTPLAFKPSKAVAGMDHYCWLLSDGVHSLQFRWRELGAWFKAVKISDKLPDIELTKVTGCTPKTADQCNTAGGHILTIETQSVCPDAKIEVGGNPCVNVTINPDYPNRLISCVLPAGVGNGLPLSISSAGRNHIFDNVVSYQAPEIKSVSGCSSGEPPFTEACVAGDTITIEGSAFGATGATVSVEGSPCQDVKHSESDPHGELTCTLGTPVNKGEGIVIMQAPPASASAASVSSSNFHGIKYAEADNTVKIVISVIVPILLIIGISFAVRYYMAIRKTKQAVRELLAPKPWRYPVDLPGASGFGPTEGVPCTLSGGTHALAYLTSKFTDPIAVDRFAEAAYNARIGSLGAFVGVSFSLNRPPAILISTDVGSGHAQAKSHDQYAADRKQKQGQFNTPMGMIPGSTTPEDSDAASASGQDKPGERSPRPGSSLAEFLGNPRAGGANISRRVRWCKEISEGLSLLHQWGIGLGEELFTAGDIELVRGDLESGEHDYRATIARDNLGAAIATKFTASRAKSEKEDVIMFGEICGALLSPDGTNIFLDNGRSANSTSHRNSHRGNTGRRSQRSHRSQGTQLVTGNSRFSHASSGGGGHRLVRYSHQILSNLRLYDGVPPGAHNVVEICFTKHALMATIAPLVESLAREVVIARIVDIRTEELRVAMERSDELLARMIPSSLLPSIKAGIKVPANVYQNATAVFTDVVGFTTLAERTSCQEVIDSLSTLSHELDKLCSAHQMYRVNTIGDAFFAVAGIPNPIKNHTFEVVEFGLRAIDAVANITLSGERLKIRVGLHSGSIAGGIQGLRIPKFDCFGDTVNVAARMESNGIQGSIQCTEETLHCLQMQCPDMNRYNVEERGFMDIKGKGQLKTFIITKGRDWR